MKLLAASEPQSKEKGGKLPWKKDLEAALKKFAEGKQFALERTRSAG